MSMRACLCGALCCTVPWCTQAMALSQWAAVVQEMRDRRSAQSVRTQPQVQCHTDCPTMRSFDATGIRCPGVAQVLLGRMVRRLRRQREAAALEGWAAWMQVQKRLCVIAQRVLGRTRIHIVSVSFCSWYDTAQERRRRRGLVQRAVGKLWRRQQAAAFGAWVKFMQRWEQHQQKLYDRGQKLARLVRLLPLRLSLNPRN